MGRFLAIRVAIAALLVSTTAPAAANQRSDELRARATYELYNLDRERAIATYREAIAADPNDAAAYRGLASALWLTITFERGNLTIDDYMGKLSRSNLKLVRPPAMAVAIRELLRAGVPGGLLVMGAHREGLMAFGRTADEAGARLLAAWERHR